MYAVLTSDSLSAYKDKKIKTIQDSQATQVRNHHNIYSDSKLLARIRPRFFDQVGHETMYASSENKHSFFKSCDRQTFQNYEQPP